MHYYQTSIIIMTMKRNTETTLIARAFRNWSCTYLLKNREMSPHSHRAYVEALTLFFIFLMEERDIKPQNLSARCFEVSVIESWIQWLKETRKCSSASCNHRLSCLRSFLGFLSSQEPQFMDFYLQARNIKPLRVPKKAHEEISQDAIQSFFKAIDQTSKTGRRDYAFFYLLYSIAARVDEILSLRVKDLFFENGSVGYVIINGKGSKRRTPPILKAVGKVLQAYIKMFHGVNPNPDSWLFPSSHSSLNGDKLSQSAIDKRIKLYSHEAHKTDSSLPENMHCHQLRHARASHWLEQGLDIVAIQRLMGHADINTTSQYIFISTGQKHKVLARLEDPTITGVSKKWKHPRIVNGLLEYLGLEGKVPNK